jgi:hypothetical protein
LDRNNKCLPVQHPNSLEAVVLAGVAVVLAVEVVLVEVVLVEVVPVVPVEVPVEVGEVVLAVEVVLAFEVVPRFVVPLHEVALPQDTLYLERKSTLSVSRDKGMAALENPYKSSPIVSKSPLPRT